MSDWCHPTVILDVSVGTTKEHLGYALALGVPVMVVVNKVDLCPSDRVERILCQLETMLKSPGCQKIPVRVNNDDDIITVASNFDSNRLAASSLMSRGTVSTIIIQNWWIRSVRFV